MQILLKNLLLLHLLTFLIIVNSQSDDSSSTYSYCPSGSNNTASTTFMYNLGGLFSGKLYNEAGKSIYYNTTEGQSPSIVYGNYICRFDYSPETCQSCIANATDSIVTYCNGTKQAIAWYNECMVRYSDTNFFSMMEIVPTVYRGNSTNASQPAEFGSVVNRTLMDLIEMAPLNEYNFATKEVNVSDALRVYSIAQCTPDLSVDVCHDCLNVAFKQFAEDDLQSKQGGSVFIPSCIMRFELYPFYESRVIVGEFVDFTVLKIFVL